MTMNDGPRAPDKAYHAVHLPEDAARARVWQAIAQHLAGWIPSGAQVLEIGAGYCSWINAVTAARRVAVDRWPEFARYAGGGVQAVVLDAATELRSLGTAEFDVVLASNVLEHFEPDVAASVVADVHALLRYGGRFIVVQPNFRYAYRRYFDDYTHRSVFTDVSLPNLLRANGFAIERVQPRFLPYSMRNRRVPAAAWLVRAYLASPVKPGAGQMLVIGRKA
jgi:cyclopropane fatty-acyl-phospholipid synthase-like methyltransferase